MNKMDITKVLKGFRERMRQETRGIKRLSCKSAKLDISTSEIKRSKEFIDESQRLINGSYDAMARNLQRQSENGLLPLSLDVRYYLLTGKRLPDDYTMANNTAHVIVNKMIEIGRSSQ